MTERTAVYYGQVELIPGILCDGYVLDDGTAVMSERGTADLLGVDHMHLNRMETNGPPKTLEPFLGEGWSMETDRVKVIAENSPYRGRKISIYHSLTIENLIRAYVLALANHKLRKDQKHIGEHCAILQSTLVRSALDVAIKESCGLSPDIQQTAQANYIDTVKLLKEFGFACSMPDDIAIKKDIAQFLDIPESTLDSFLRKHKEDIPPIKLDRATIRAGGYKASSMNGYHLDNVSKIVLGMNSVMSLQFKKKVFGQLGPFVQPQTPVEIQWREVLSKVFAGFDLICNHQIGSYKVDFFVAKLLLVLECNGYCHKYYDIAQETAREQFILQRYSIIRFHHQIDLETLVNAILHAKPGQVIQLYDLNQLGQEMPFGLNHKYSN